MNATPADIVAAVRARGSDTDNLRDAAHEAHHAIEAGVPEGQWDRESIHVAVMAMGRGKAAASEVMARAIEQIVCADLGVDCGEIEKWALKACFEAVKSGVAFPGPTWFANAVRVVMGTASARAAADAVLALAVVTAEPSKKQPKPLRKRRS